MKSYQKIMCATDCSDFCRVATERAAELARFYDAQLYLFHVVEHFPVNRSNELIAPEDVDPKEYHEKRVHNSLAELARSLGYEKVAQEVRFSSRTAKHAIVRFAREQDVDLIVMATHGRHGLTSTLGSTSYGVTHTAPCDVMVISSHKLS